MPIYLVERNFDQELDISSDQLDQINQITSEIGAHWLTTFLSADGKKSYCLYEASDKEQLRQHSKVVGIPADEILEVNRMWPKEN